MKPGISSRLRVVDSHTCGQSTRVIVDGSGLAAGSHPLLAQAELREQRDWVRRMAVLEPRGNRSMFAAALIEPANAGGEFGVVYMDAYGYPNMCGHATIGVATTLFEEGLISAALADHSGVIELGLLTPAGRVQLRLHLQADRIASVAFQTPLAFHLRSLEVTVEGLPKQVEVAYGGQWYAFIDVAGTGLRVEPDCIDRLVELSAVVRASLLEAGDIIDPMSGSVPNPINIVWLDRPVSPAASSRNVPVSPAGSFDRSPCGTATCARMATLVAQGVLAIGDTFVNEGLLGTLYHGRAVRRADDAGIAGIVPEVAGQAWITGRAVLSCDPDDPLRQGFLVGGGPAVR